MSLPVPNTAENLKSYFETGDIPTEAQCANLIDTMFANDAECAAAAAEAAEAAAEVQSAMDGAHFAAAAKLQWLTGDPSTWRKVKSYNIGTVEQENPEVLRFKVTFITPFDDANYVVDGQAFGNGVFTIHSRNAAYFEFNVSLAQNNADVVIFAIY